MMKAMIRCAVAAVFAMIGHQAYGQTVTRVLSLNPYGADIAQGSGSPGPGARYGSGYSGTNGGIGPVVMPDPAAAGGGTSRFQMGFVVPDDYVAGTPLVLLVTWRADVLSCTVGLRNNFLTLAQPGLENVSGALVLDGPAPAMGPVAKVSVRTRYRFNFSVPFEPTDTISFGLFRSMVNDTCAGDVHIQGLAIEYQALAKWGGFTDGFEAIG